MKDGRVGTFKSEVTMDRLAQTNVGTGNTNEAHIGSVHKAAIGSFNVQVHLKELVQTNNGTGHTNKLAVGSVTN